MKKFLSLILILLIISTSFLSCAKSDGSDDLPDDDKTNSDASADDPSDKISFPLIYDASSDVNFLLPDSFYLAESEQGANKLDGIVNENEYGLAIKKLSLWNGYHTYGHNTAFSVRNGKDSSFLSSSWYLGFDGESLWWAVVFHDTANGEKAEKAASASRAMLDLFVGEPSNEKSFGIQLNKYTDGTIKTSYNFEAAFSSGAEEYPEENFKYNEIINSDGTRDEIWEARIPLADIKEYTGLSELGEHFYFKFIAETDNAFEEVTDRYQIGASKIGDAPLLDNEKYWATKNCSVRLFSITVGEPRKTDTNDADEGSEWIPTGIPMTFEAGYGKACITPAWEGQGLSGDQNNRPISGVYSDLYAICTAIRDADSNTTLLFTLDALTPFPEATTPIRQEISDKTGIPFENIIINCSHTHFAPAFRNASTNNVNYPVLHDGCLAAAEAALADLAPAEIYTGVIRTEGLIFTRRFVDRNNNGRYEPQTRKEIENPVDENAYVINLARKGKKDIVLTNVAVHSTASSGTNYQISSSIFGATRNAFEKKNDAYLCIYQGAAGNSIPKEWVETSGNGTRGDGLIFDPHFVGADKYGEKLAEYITKCLKNNMTKHETERGVRAINKTETLVVDKSRSFEVDIAKTIRTEWDTNGIKGNTKRYNELCEKYGIDTYQETTKIITCALNPEISNAELCAIAVGDIGFACAGYEMLSVTGDELRESSPFEFTFVLGYTNDIHGYIPQADAFENGGYEVGACQYIKGTAEQIRDSLLTLLNKLY